VRYQTFRSRYHFLPPFGLSHQLVLKEDSSWRNVNGVFWIFRGRSHWLTFRKDVP